METKDGGGCYVSVECQNGGKKEYFADKKGWNVCFVGGEQRLNDPRIGEFSVTFTKRDGEGQGLTDPVIKLASVGDWQKPIDVKSQNGHSRSCDKGPCKKECDRDVICSHWVSWSNMRERKKKWACGVPVLGSDPGAWLL
jgi:hypothetical protein